jgi:hypothetical protein
MRLSATELSIGYRNHLVGSGARVVPRAEPRVRLSGHHQANALIVTQEYAALAG